MTNFQIKPVPVLHTKTTEMFVVFQTSVSFLVYDRDVNWQGQSDDFMGSCNLEMTLVRNKLLLQLSRAEL